MNSTEFKRGVREHVLWKEMAGRRWYWIADGDNPDLGVWSQEQPLDSDYWFKGTEEVHAFVDRMTHPGKYFTATADDLIDDTLYHIPASVTTIVKD